MISEVVQRTVERAATHPCTVHLKLYTAGAVTARVLEALVALVLQHRIAGVGAGERTVVAALDVLGRGTGVQDGGLRGNGDRVDCQRGNEEKDRLGAGKHLCRLAWDLIRLDGTGLVVGFETTVGLEE